MHAYSFYFILDLDNIEDNYEQSIFSDDKKPWYEGRWGRQAMMDTSPEENLKSLFRREVMYELLRRRLEGDMLEEKRQQGDNEGSWYSNRWGREAIGGAKSRDNKNEIPDWFSSRWGRKRTNADKILQNMRDIFE